MLWCCESTTLGTLPAATAFFVLWLGSRVLPKAGPGGCHFFVWVDLPVISRSAPATWTDTPPDPTGDCRSPACAHGVVGGGRHAHAHAHTAAATTAVTAPPTHPAQKVIVLVREELARRDSARNGRDPRVPVARSFGLSHGPLG